MPKFPKRRRLRLEAKAYDELRSQIMQRDGWRCQICGCRVFLEVHHLKTRGRGGDDAETNLVTLCRMCHGILHNKSRPRRADKT